ncbi:hypothetical protein AHAS_Ahas09G0158700 [Arachis hypogaea]
MIEVLLLMRNLTVNLSSPEFEPFYLLQYYSLFCDLEVVEELVTDLVILVARCCPSSADRTVKFWDLETFELIGSARHETSMEMTKIRDELNEKVSEIKGLQIELTRRESDVAGEAVDSLKRLVKTLEKENATLKVSRFVTFCPLNLLLISKRLIFFSCEFVIFTSKMHSTVTHCSHFLLDEKE